MALIWIIGQSYYRRHRRRDRGISDIIIHCNVLSRITKAYYTGFSGVRLKSLVTSLKASLYAKHLFPKEKGLNLPTEMHANDGNGLTLTEVEILTSVCRVQESHQGLVDWEMFANLDKERPHQQQGTDTRLRGF